jgi:hypothetical protein
MNTPILNREFQHPADGWYHIEPKGEHPSYTSTDQRDQVLKMDWTTLPVVTNTAAVAAISTPAGAPTK